MSYKPIPEDVRAYCREHFEFDFEKGEVLAKKCRKFTPDKLGAPVGSFHKGTGTRTLNVRKKKYELHRLLYAEYHDAEISGLRVCHIDGDRTNNAIDNLLGIDPSMVRSHDSRVESKSGFTGVIQDAKSGVWVVFLSFKGKNEYLGRFARKRDAIFRRKLAEIHYGFIYV